MCEGGGADHCVACRRRGLGWGVLVWRPGDPPEYIGEARGRQCWDVWCTWSWALGCAPALPLHLLSPRRAYLPLGLPVPLRHWHIQLLALTAGTCHGRQHLHLRTPAPAALALHMAQPQGPFDKCCCRTGLQEAAEVRGGGAGGGGAGMGGGGRRGVQLLRDMQAAGAGVGMFWRGGRGSKEGRQGEGSAGSTHVVDAQPYRHP